MPICLPQQCLALVYGLPAPGYPLFRESSGWWVRLQSVGHRHRMCSYGFVPENFESFRNTSCFRVARSQQKKTKNQEEDAQPEKIKRKIDFSYLRNPPKNFTPLFGEVAKFETLTKKEEQQSRDEVEQCLPRNT